MSDRRSPVASDADADDACSNGDLADSAGGDRDSGRTAVDRDHHGGTETGLHVAVETYRIGTDATPAELLATARVYARAVVEAHDLSVSVSRLEWEVSRRAKRRAGAVRYRDGHPEAIVLAWLQFQNRGWRATAATIRHELLHVHLLNECADPSHGPMFRQLAETLDTHIHCDRFVDPAWWVRCTECGAELARYRRSKLVTDPDRYRCGECGGRYRVVRADDTDDTEGDDSNGHE